MLTRTHVTICLFFVLLFLPLVESKVSFVFISFFATLFPDIDSSFSKIGKKKLFRPLQFFVSHRGFLHSFIFLGLVLLPLYLFESSFLFPFFMGYSIHLLSDALTIRGIRPFYPYGKRFSGFIKTGERMEVLFFIIFLMGSLVLFYRYLLTIF